jgi:hypothetical protein
MRYHERPDDPTAFDKLFHKKVVRRANTEVWDPRLRRTVSYQSSQLDRMVREPDADLDEFMGSAIAQHQAASLAALEQLAAAGRPKRRADEEVDDLHSVGGDSSVGMIDIVPLVQGRKARRVRDVRERQEDEKRVQFNPEVQQKRIPGILRRVAPIVPATLNTEDQDEDEDPQGGRAHYAAGGALQLARPPPAPDEAERRDEESEIC